MAQQDIQISVPIIGVDIAPVAYAEQILDRGTNMTLDEVAKKSVAYGPYASVAAAHTALSADGLNTVGTTVGISGSNNTVVEYWYQGGTAQANLVKKQSDVTIDAYTKAESDDKYQQKVTGKGLSTNDYTNEEKQKVADALAPADIAGKANASDVYTKSETYTKTEVNALVDTPHQKYETVDAYANLPATGSKDTIYRVSNYNGSTSQVDVSVYSEYAWNGSQYVFLCVKSQIGEVFDISVYNNNAKYADLAAALNGGANIPQSLQKGGMSVKFVQSSDNKYVQFRLVAQTFSTNEVDWQEMNTVRGENVYNANYGKSPGTSFTLSTAIQDVPLSYRRTGLILIFRDNSLNVNAYHYKAAQVGDQYFEDITNWVQIPIRPILMSLCDNKLLRAIGIADSVFPQWTSNTLYKVGAIIKYDDNLMRCKTEHTSGESYDASKFGITTYGEFLRRYGGSVVLNYTMMKSVAPISFTSLNSTFLATIDSLYREAGLILMIRTSNKGILYYQYNTANVTDEYWNDTSNWVLLYSTAWGINNDFISQITQTINKVKELTENVQLTLQNTGKAYNTGTVSVGSVYTESLAGNSIIDSGKVSVKKGDTLYIKGKGAINPRLWCIVDNSNKVVAISEAGAASTQYIRLDINQGGTVYYNTRNDEQDYPFGGYIVTADNITAIADKIAYITDEPKVISFDNEGKAYNTGNVAVGSTFGGTLSTNATFDSARVTVKKNDVVLVKGQGGITPLLWCITDTTGKVLSKSESSFHAYEYVTIVIGQDGYVYLNARNDSEDCPLGALLTNNYNLPYLSELVNKKPTGKWLAMGDSITEGYYSYFTDEPNDVGAYLIIPTKTWVYKLSAMIGKPVINAGIGGTGYKKKGTQGDKLNAKELVDTLDFTGVDVVTLAYGINDYKGSETLGTMADDVSTGNTVVANMRYVIEHIIASNPNIKILVMMPLNARGYSSQRLGDETTNYALGYQVNNKTLQDFYDAMVEVCKYYGIEYVDATHTSVINRKSAAKLLPDGVHPSENAHTLLAKEFARVLIR